MPLETIAENTKEKEPTEEELEVIMKSFSERIEWDGVHPTNYNIEVLARAYYTLSGIEFNGDLVRTMVNTYLLGYARAKNLFED